MTFFLSNYGLFLAKGLTTIILILVAYVGLVTIFKKSKSISKEKLKITKFNQKYLKMRGDINNAILEKTELKKITQQEKQLQSKGSQSKKISRIFVLNFNGDHKASAVENLREEITAILTVATPEDEVLIKIESNGGMVHGYGLAASQLMRFREHKIPLIAAVDRVAASGGYLMACVANHILAAPFAIIGSIGVIAELPNFNRFLKKYDIDFDRIVSGKYKQPLSVFGENTEENKAMYQQKMDETHALFKSFVSTNRSKVDINSVATGEVWHGKIAKEIGLIDEIMTSDDYLLAASNRVAVFGIEYLARKKNFIEKIVTPMKTAISDILLGCINI